MHSLLVYEYCYLSCRKDGNPFNATTAPLPAPASPFPSTPSPTPPTPALSGPPTSPSSGRKTPGKQADGPTSSEESNSGGKKFLTTKKVVWISIAGVLLFVIMALGLVLFTPRCSRRREEAGGIFKRHQVGAYKGNRENPRDTGSLAEPTNQREKGKDFFHLNHLLLCKALILLLNDMF